MGSSAVPTWSTQGGRTLVWAGDLCAEAQRNFQLFLVRDAEAPSSRPMVLKVINPKHERNALLLEALRNEGEVLRRLPFREQIVGFEEYGLLAGKTPYVLLRYVYGENLRDVLARTAERRLTLGQVAAVIGNICQALDHLHTSGMVHLDIKPSNVVLNYDSPGAVLIDFNAVAPLSGGRDDTSGFLPPRRNMPRTLPYAAPEQLSNDPHVYVDERTDIHALGVTTFELLTGVRLFADHRGALAHDDLGPSDLERLLKPLFPAAAEGLASLLAESVRADQAQRAPRTAGKFAEGLLAASAAIVAQAE